MYLHFWVVVILFDSAIVKVLMIPYIFIPWTFTVCKRDDNDYNDDASNLTEKRQGKKAKVNSYSASHDN